MSVLTRACLLFSLVLLWSGATFAAQSDTLPGPLQRDPAVALAPSFQNYYGGPWHLAEARAAAARFS